MEQGWLLYFMDGEIQPQHTHGLPWGKVPLELGLPRSYSMLGREQASSEMLGTFTFQYIIFSEEVRGLSQAL